VTGFKLVYFSQCRVTGELLYPITLYCDNKSAIELVKNVTFHSRTKHIAIRYHYIREAYNDGPIVLNHRGTDDMPAVIFTKP